MQTAQCLELGGVHKTCGNSGGVGGLFLYSKNGNSGEEGGTCVKFPPWWGYGYFLELHIGYLISLYKSQWYTE